MVVAKSFIIVCLRILDGVFDRSMVGCKDVWCVATLVVLMFSVCRPCAQVAGMATEEGGTATAATAPATLEAEPRGVRHRTFSRDDPGTPACARYQIPRLLCYLRAYYHCTFPLRNYSHVAVLTMCVIKSC
jgi:hypothetical protein